MTIEDDEVDMNRILELLDSLESAEKDEASAVVYPTYRDESHASLAYARGVRAMNRGEVR